MAERGPRGRRGERSSTAGSSAGGLFSGDVRAAARYLPQTLQLVLQADRSGTLALGLIALLLGSLPLAQAFAGQLIVDEVVAAIAAGRAAADGLRAVLPWLALEFGLLALSAVLVQWRIYSEHIVHARLKQHVNQLIIRRALTLDLHYFEDPQYYDKLQNARRESDRRALTIINTGLSLLQHTITLGSFAVSLIAFNPWLALLLFGATIPAFVTQSQYSRLNFRLLTWRAPEFRRMNYLEYLLTVDHSAKEIKLYGLGEPLLALYQAHFARFFDEDAALSRRRSLLSVVWGLVANLGYYISYGWIVLLTVGGGLTLGAMTFYLALFRQSQSSFQQIFSGIAGLFESGLFMVNLFDYLSLTPQLRNGRHLPLPTTIRDGIEFDNVGFRYPDREDWALRNISLKIGPNEKIALVGENGAGKTTLIKLLTRLYDPTEGRILLDGVDLRDYDLDDLRRRIGVIFQDFVRFQATVGDNIGYGQVEALTDEPRIRSAAERGGADEVIATLPAGAATMLGRWFEQGVELSGGQWQKIALSRAFMRDSDVLVLDEPTSALDAAREYEIFQRFRELTAGRIALLISHRFSTVRMADRIVVLERGTLIESGSHEALLAAGGRYAELFTKQAEGYR